MTHVSKNNLPPPKSTSEEHPAPPAMRVINDIGAALSRVGIAIPNTDLAKIKAKAQRVFGESSPSLDEIPITWRGFEAMLEDMATDPNHSLIGKSAAVAEIQRQLVTALKLEQFARSNPAVMAQPITRPLFVVGFPRTGTTLLHRLISRDPQMRAPLLWELLAPIPEPGETSPDARIGGAKKFMAQTERFAPALNIAHPMAVFEPEECVFLIMQNHIWLGRLILQKYREWMSSYEPTLEYERYARYLKVLQRDQPGKTWVLKSPHHLHGLGALLDTFSDAMVIQTHRAPSTLFPSWMSLAMTAYALGERHLDLKWIANWWLDIWVEQMKRAEAARAANPTRFIDVHFGDVVSKPIETVEDVYERLGLNLSGAAVDAMRGWLNTQVRGKFHEHRYTPEQFGLNKAALNERFKWYVEKYDIPVV